MAYLRKPGESAKVATLASRIKGTGRSVLCRNMSLFAFVLTHELQIQHQSCSPVGDIHRNFDRLHFVGTVGLVGQRERSTNHRRFESSAFANPFEHVGTDCASRGQTGRLDAVEGGRV